MSRDDLDAIHAALLLGRPVQLPPGTVLRVVVVDSYRNQQKVAEYTVPDEGRKATVRTTTTGGLVVHAGPPGWSCSWLDVLRIDRIISVPDSPAAQLLLVELQR